MGENLAIINWTLPTNNSDYAVQRNTFVTEYHGMTTAEFHKMTPAAHASDIEFMAQGVESGKDSNAACRLGNYVSMLTAQEQKAVWSQIQIDNMKIWNGLPKVEFGFDDGHVSGITINGHTGVGVRACDVTSLPQTGDAYPF